MASRKGAQRLCHRDPSPALGVTAEAKSDDGHQVAEGVLGYVLEQLMYD